MGFGFVKIGTYTPFVKVADVKQNVESIIKGINLAYDENVNVLIFPELSLTGYTSYDLFNYDVLKDGVVKGLGQIISATQGKKMLVCVGLPLVKGNLNYDVAGVICDGKLLAFIPKQNLCDYNSLYEKRYFAPAPSQNDYINFNGERVPFGNKVIFTYGESVRIAVEIGSDAVMPITPSSIHSISGANIILNLNAVGHVVGMDSNIRKRAESLSRSLNCAYALASAGLGESTTDGVFGGYNVIAENGKTLVQSDVFGMGLKTAYVDVDYLNFERQKMYNQQFPDNTEYVKIQFDMIEPTSLERQYSKTPFIPAKEYMDERAEEILNIQARALSSRLTYINAKTLVIGLSGGLDSTLAILVCAKAIKLANRSLKDIVAITMPCFGTTSRTFDNTIKLSKALGVTIKKIDIGKSVKRHLKDINHGVTLLDVTYENAQARERTQVLMDVANMTNGIVVGTGDLSEVALGWSTYNGDHMSMYGVNCSVPKTLVRHIVSFVAKNSKGKLKSTLLDILDTPVSPELLPPAEGEIAQKTEDIVGPYILHDFFLYHLIRRGSSPKKIFYIAKNTFAGEYDEQTILKWLKIFIKRFFMQQFKRSCVPDGVKVGSVALSPRGDWKMPSDATPSLWLEELEKM